jgi:hypothetical protein
VPRDEWRIFHGRCSEFPEPRTDKTGRTDPTLLCTYRDMYVPDPIRKAAPRDVSGREGAMVTAICVRSLCNIQVGNRIRSPLKLQVT